MNNTNKHSNKKYLLFLLVLLILVSLFFINFFRSNHAAEGTSKTINRNLSAIATFDYSKVSTIESEIKKLETTEARGTFDVTKKLTKAQYRKILSTSVIIGDSITEGLSDYGYLGSDHVFCKIGASIISGDELFASAASTYPKVAFMAFGMNDMGNYSGDSQMFIEKYTKLIEEFLETSPDTKICVNAISRPSDEALDKNEILKNYKEFNKAIKGMCKDLNLTYIDNSYILDDHPDYYAADGIHVVSDYYPLWMNNMILKAGL